MKIWKRFKAKVKRAWGQFKTWFYGILISLGLVVAMPIQAVETIFTYIRATEYSDGTPMPLSEIKETRLYCDGELVSSEPGADQNFNPDLTPGNYSCYAVHGDIFGREGDRSNIVEKVVLPSLLGAPVLDE